MIVSHKHKFIFVKTKKTAGTSIEIALSEICGPDDIITSITPEDEAARKKMGFRGAQNFWIPFSKYTRMDWLKLVLTGKRAKFYNHMACDQMVDYLDPQQWKTYFKFTFDRNPYDKMVSLYYWRDADKKYPTIADFIRSGDLKSVRSFDRYSLGKIVAVDRVYKFEELAESLVDISNRIGLEQPLKMPDYRAKSKTRKVQDHRQV